MSSLVILECKITRVLAPLPEVEKILIGERGHVYLHLSTGSHVEECRSGLRQAVTGLGIVEPAEFRLNLVLGGGLSERYLPLLDVLSLNRSYFLRVGRPVKSGIIVLVSTVKTQLTLVSADRGSGRCIGSL